MARPRPAYRAPLREYPSQPSASFELMLTKRTPFNDFSEGSGRRQCKAIGRKTHAQCRCNAMNGSDYCWHHRGPLKLEKVVKQFHPDAKVLVKDGTLRKRYYASIAFSDVIAHNIAPHVRREAEKLSAGPRGRKYEEWLNKKKT